MSQTGIRHRRLDRCQGQWVVEAVESRLSSFCVGVTLIASVYLLLGGGRLYAASSGDPTPSRQLSAMARIQFHGTSTLHDFEGTVMSQPFVLVLSSNSWSAEANVLGNEMTTAHNGRDKNMNKMLETSQYPRLYGAVRNAAIPTAGTTNASVTLRIRDRSLDLPVTISDWSETAGAVRFQVTWRLSLKQYKLKPPSVLGVVRVGDEVRLVAQVTAKKPEPATVTPGAEVPDNTQP